MHEVERTIRLVDIYFDFIGMTHIGLEETLKQYIECMKISEKEVKRFIPY